MQCFNAMLKRIETTILDKRSVDIFMFQHSFFSIQVKQDQNAISKKQMYELNYELLNELSLRISRNQEILGKSLKQLDLMATRQPTTEKVNFTFVLKSRKNSAVKNIPLENILYLLQPICRESFAQYCRNKFEIIRKDIPIMRFDIR